MACEAAVDGLTLRIFNHNLYEYGRGVRGLFMMTMSDRDLAPIKVRLDSQGIAHFVQRVNACKINLFFGRTPYVDTVGSFLTRPLSQLTPEEDFMLGTLLGYDREQQCLRYLARSLTPVAPWRDAGRHEAGEHGQAAAGQDPDLGRSAWLAAL